MVAICSHIALITVMTVSVQRCYINQTNNQRIKMHLVQMLLHAVSLDDVKPVSHFSYL